MEAPHETVWHGVRGRPRPRARWFVLAAILIVLAAGAIFGYLWLSAYAPLRFDGGVTMAGNRGTLPVSRVDPGVGEPVLYASMNEPGWTEFGFDVTNTGSIPVTVEGLAPTSDPLTLAGRGETSLGGAAAAGQAYPHIVPFGKTEIGPGEMRYLSFRVQIAEPCNGDYVRGSMFSYESIRLRYRYFGVFERDARVDMPFAVALVCGRLPDSYDASQ